MKTNEDNSQYFKVDQAADMLGVTKRFLELEIERRRLAVVRLSRRAVRIRRVDLDAYVERNRKAAIGEKPAGKRR